MVVHPLTGKLGAASNMRLATSLGTLIHVAAAAECYSLALAKDVSAQLVYDLIAGAAGSSHQFNVRFLDMLAGNFEAKPGTDNLSLQSASNDLVRICFYLP
jgi:3-hydroxyisobutyrate dehydrogenase-like beta-hydroxyacid dehydrogenase